MVSPSLPMSAHLFLSTNGTGGALTGHSTAAHRSLRSLPPALQPGIKEAIKTKGLSGWSTTTKDALSGAQYVMKEMEDMEVTLRPEERGIFEHLPPECQKSRNSKASLKNEDECGKYAKVKMRDCACADQSRTSSHAGPLISECVHLSQNVVNSEQTTDSIESFGQVKVS